MNSSYDESLLQPAIVETIVQMHARPTPTERRAEGAMDTTWLDEFHIHDEDDAVLVHTCGANLGEVDLHSLGALVERAQSHGYDGCGEAQTDQAGLSSERLAEIRALVVDADENGFDWADYEEPSCNCSGVCKWCETPRNPRDEDFFPAARDLLAEVDRLTGLMSAEDDAADGVADALEDTAQALAEVTAERDQLRAEHWNAFGLRHRDTAAIQRVRNLHDIDAAGALCVSCTVGDPVPWPCDTIRALDGEA